MTNIITALSGLLVAHCHFHVANFTSISKRFLSRTPEYSDPMWEHSTGLSVLRYSQSCEHPSQSLGIGGLRQQGSPLTAATSNTAKHITTKYPGRFQILSVHPPWNILHFQLITIKTSTVNNLVAPDFYVGSEGGPTQKYLVVYKVDKVKSIKSFKRYISGKAP